MRTKVNSIRIYVCASACGTEPINHNEHTNTKFKSPAWIPEKPARMCSQTNLRYFELAGRCLYWLALINGAKTTLVVQTETILILLVSGGSLFAIVFHPHVGFLFCAHLSTCNVLVLGTCLGLESCFFDSCSYLLVLLRAAGGVAATVSPTDKQIRNYEPVTYKPRK